MALFIENHARVKAAIVAQCCPDAKRETRHKYKIKHGDQQVELKRGADTDTEHVGNPLIRGAGEDFHGTLSPRVSRLCLICFTHFIYIPQNTILFVFIRVGSTVVNNPGEHWSRPL